MKRVQSACILQTLIFSQKPESDFSKERAEKINREEVEVYQKRMERAGIRYQIINKEVREDGAIIVRVRKQYNSSDVGEYFV